MGATPKKTAIVYCRTSTGAQKERETIGAQIERCTALVERHDLRVLKYGPKRDGWIIDDGVSGSLLEGREFAQVIDDLRSRELTVDRLVVFSLSRLARPDKSSKDPHKLERSQVDATTIRAVLQGAGVIVIDEEGENDPSTLTFDIKMVIAAEQYKLIRATTMNGKARWLREGRFARGGRPPYGYRQMPNNGVDGKAGFHLEADPVNAKRVRKIFGWFVEGGYAHAARKANEAGWAPSSAATKRKAKAAGWNDSVRYIISHARVYLGEQTVKLGDEVHTIKFPSIIDAEFFRRIDRAQKEATIDPRAAQLTTGLVDCGCGAHLMQHRSHEKYIAKCREKCGAVHEPLFSTTLWEATKLRLLQLRVREKGGNRKGDAFAAQLRAATESVGAARDSIRELMVMKQAGLDFTTWRAENGKLNDKLALAQADVDRITRERAAYEEKRATAETLESRIDALLAELVRGGEPPMPRKREILGNVLAGERVTVEWGGTGDGRWAAMTFPALDGLEPLTARTDRPVLPLEGTAAFVGGKLDALRVRTFRGKSTVRATLDDLIASVAAEGEWEYERAGAKAET
jgi:DNA invertase Pin-like site-specific DNA recombinase